MVHTVKMDFAKNLLLKYGWKEGQGIGKNLDGINQPIKANLKFDNTGLCYDKATEFTDHWWEKAFNDASKNLNVDNSSESVALSVKNQSSFEISTNGISLENLNHKTAESLTDDDILKACGGRTAHKGARHGLLSLGKLNRIDAQEQQMLEKMGINKDDASSIFKDWVKVTKKHKKHKKSNKEQRNKTNTTASDTELDYKIGYKSKKKKKIHRQRDEDLARSLSKLKTDDSTPSTFDCIQDTSRTIKKENPSKVKSRKKHTSNKTEADCYSKLSNETKCTTSKHKKLLKLTYIFSDESGGEQCEDPLKYQFENVVKRYPREKCKDLQSMKKSELKVKLESKNQRKKKDDIEVVSKDLLSMKKSELKIKLKSKNRRKKKDDIEINKISKKFQKKLIVENE